VEKVKTSNYLDAMRDALKLQPDFYQDSPEYFELYKDNLLDVYKDEFLAFAAKHKGQLVLAYEDDQGQNLILEAWDIDEFLTTCPEDDHSHIVVKSLVPKLTGKGAECIVLVIDMHHNCNAIYIRKVEPKNSRGQAIKGFKDYIKQKNV